MSFAARQRLWRRKVDGILGAAAGTGSVIEFAGPTIEGLSMEARMSLCNMAIEAGARVGLIAPDDVTFEYIKGRPLAPDERLWEDAVQTWKGLRTDAGARFEREVRFNAEDLVPTVTWGTSPEQTVSIAGFVPHPQSFDEDAKRQSCKRALEYMGLQPGTRMTDVAIDKVFIGSCTNSRLEDLRSAASILRGRKISPSLKAAYVVPGSGTVKLQAEHEGLDRIFKSAGFEWREAGCSMCVGLNEDQLDAYERAASTTNRNFENRQGTAGRTHLMSPVMAAAAAIEGKLVDARKFVREAVRPVIPMRYPEHLDEEPEEDEGYGSTDSSKVDVHAVEPFRTLEGVVAPFDIANADTDMILPKQFCTTILRTGLGNALFYNLRWNPDGSTNASFILNREPFNRSSILLCTQENFGCGSSREHAVWALLDFGIQCVLAPSFGDIFYNNSFKNGMLAAIIDQDTIAAIVPRAKAGHNIKIDLERQAILEEDGTELGDFQIDTHRKHNLLEGLDEIALALRFDDHIKRYETKVKTRWPWLDTCISDGWNRRKDGKSLSRDATTRPEAAVDRKDFEW